MEQTIMMNPTAMDSSKTYTSIMLCGNAEGEMLPTCFIQSRTFVYYMERKWAFRP
jgi:hypothetical protein